MEALEATSVLWAEGMAWDNVIVPRGRGSILIVMTCKLDNWLVVDHPHITSAPFAVLCHQWVAELTQRAAGT